MRFLFGSTFVFLIAFNFLLSLMGLRSLKITIKDVWCLRSSSIACHCQSKSAPSQSICINSSLPWGSCVLECYANSFLGSPNGLWPLLGRILCRSSRIDGQVLWSGKLCTCLIIFLNSLKAAYSLLSIMLSISCLLIALGSSLHLAACTSSLMIQSCINTLIHLFSCYINSWVIV